MQQEKNLCTGKIFPTLNRFALPIIFAMIFQALYGCVDMLIVARFSSTEEISGVASGGLLMVLVADALTTMATGVTILVGNFTGAKDNDKVGYSIGSGISLFSMLAAIIMAILMTMPRGIARLLQAPEEAMLSTSQYLFWCGSGMFFIMGYNLLSAIFRGLGDSKTPLLTVGTACFCNILGDILLVAGLKMGAKGAAIATVLSQGISVVLSLLFILRRKQNFKLERKHFGLFRQYTYDILKLGIPLALQDAMVSLSFLAIQIVSNSINVVSSAAIGIGEKLSYFIMLVPISYMSAMSAFTAQNIGANQPERCKKALFLGMIPSTAFGLTMGAILFWRADLFARIFTNDEAVILASTGYLHVYALDCIITPVMFCFFGYYTGRGNSLFVMLQGMIGSFGIRIPSAIIARYVFDSESLFAIGVGSPCASLLQLIICFVFYAWTLRHHAEGQPA